MKNGTFNLFCDNLFHLSYFHWEEQSFRTYFPIELGR